MVKCFETNLSNIKTHHSMTRCSTAEGQVNNGPNASKVTSVVFILGYRQAMRFNSRHGLPLVHLPALANYEGILQCLEFVFLPVTLMQDDGVEGASKTWEVFRTFIRATLIAGFLGLPQADRCPCSFWKTMRKEEILLSAMV